MKKEKQILLQTVTDLLFRGVIKIKRNITWKELKSIISAKEMNSFSDIIEKLTPLNIEEFEFVDRDTYAQGNTIFFKRFLFTNLRIKKVNMFNGQEIFHRHLNYRKPMNTKKNNVCVFFYPYGSDDRITLKTGDIIIIPTGFKIKDYNPDKNYFLEIIDYCYDDFIITEKLRPSDFTLPDDARTITMTANKELFLSDDGEIIFPLQFRSTHKKRMEYYEPFLCCRISYY